MRTFDDLVTLALLGTARHSGPLPPMPAEVSAVTEAAAAAGPADSALRLANALAVLSNYTRSGTIPLPAPALPAPCPRDAWPECSERAAAVLARLLHAGPRELLAEWLGAARAASQRPPHRLLPALLDAAATHRPLRSRVEAVMDARGAWLARLNSRWRFAEQTGGGVDEVWQTGQRDQRQALLQELRSTDPARALELLQSTWLQEPADDRVRWLTTLDIGLAAADEPFLESCLDDRSSRVREAAADLLSRMPQSRLVQRLAERLEQMLVEKKGRRPTLEVILPADFDPAWARDGISERPATKTGKKEWWLTQMLMRVPPRHWSDRFRMEPAALLAAITEDYRASVAEAWMSAVVRHPEEAWSQALLDWVCALPAKRREELLPRLPAATLLANLPRLIKQGWADLEVAEQLLGFQGTLTLADCDALAELVIAQRHWSWEFSSLLNRLAYLAPVEALPHFQQRWTIEALGERFRHCDGFFAILQLRHEIHSELRP